MTQMTQIARAVFGTRYVAAPHRGRRGLALAVRARHVVTHRPRARAGGAGRARRRQLARAQDATSAGSACNSAAGGSSSRTCASTACCRRATPWLVAKRIDVSLTWGALLHREVLLDSIEMSDWRMVVETFPDGRQTFPRVNGPPRPPRTGPAPVVTTLQYVRATRGEFVVRGLRRAVGRGDAQHRRHRRQARRLPRHGALHRRDRHHPELRADERRHVGDLQDCERPG